MKRSVFHSILLFLIVGTWPNLTCRAGNQRGGGTPTTPAKYSIPTLNYAVIDLGKDVMPDSASADQIAMSPDASSLAFSWSDGTGYYVIALHNGQRVAVSPQSGGGLLAPTGGLYGFSNPNGEYSGVVTGDGTFVHETCVLDPTGDITELGVIGIGYGASATGFLPAPPFNPYAWDDPKPASFHPLDVTAWGPNGTAGAFVWEGSGGADDTHPFLGNYIFGVGVGTQINGGYNGPIIMSWSNPQFPEPSPLGTIAIVNDNKDFVLQNGPDGQYIYYAKAVEMGDLRTKLFLDIYQDQISYGSNSQMISLTNSGKMLLRMDLIQPIPNATTSQESTQLFIADTTIDPSNPSAIKKDLKVVGVSDAWNIQFPLMPPAVSNGHGATHNQITEQNVIDAIGVRIKDDAGNPISHQPQRPVLLFPVELAVDANRDGTIALGSVVDQTTPAKPYRFWVNDDQDSTVTHPFGSNSVVTEGEMVPVITPDFADTTIQCERDLEDWTRLWINVSGSSAFIKGLVQSGYSVGLQFEPLPGDTTDPVPQIKICESADSTGSTGYITSDATASQQIAAPYNVPIADHSGNTIIGSTPFMLPSTFWNDVTDSNPKHLLFEGCAEGRGKLKLVFYDSHSNKIGEGGAMYLDIKNIKKMYERVKATPPNIDLPYSYTGPNNAPPEPTIHWIQDPNGYAPDYSPVSWQQTSQYIVFVHGWNMTYADATNFAETMFKRLWQRGYTGRFVRFYWPTYVGDGTFNNSEYRAWKCGDGLKQFMASLPTGYTKDLVSHSMGAIVCGSALKSGMSVDNYALLNAAISASCFDDNIALYQPWNYTTPDGDVDAVTRALGYRGQLESVSGNPVNFYLTQDQATTTLWEYNNELFKPQGFGSGGPGYFYHPQGTAGYKLGISYGVTAGRFVTTAHEAMAYVDQSSTKTTGAESRTAGAIKRSVDMDNYNFGSEHSAEFNFTVQKTEQFYNKLLERLLLPFVE